MIPFDKSLLHVLATWLALAAVAWGVLRLREWAARAWAERERARAFDGVDLLDD